MAVIKITPPRRIKTNSALWKRRYKTVVETYLPRIVNCETCGSPRHYSYICQFCGWE